MPSVKRAALPCDLPVMLQICAYFIEAANLLSHLTILNLSAAGAHILTERTQSVGCHGDIQGASPQ